MIELKQPFLSIELYFFLPVVLRSARWLLSGTDMQGGWGYIRVPKSLQMRKQFEATRLAPYDLSKSSGYNFIGMK